MSQTLLHRVSIRPGHLDAWLATWPEQVRLREQHGFTHLQAYLCLLYTSPSPRD